MSFFDFIFGSSIKPRYNIFVDRREAKSILSSLVKGDFVYGNNLATKAVSALKLNPITSKLVYGNDLVSKVRETELVEIIRCLYQDNYISHSLFGSASQAIQKALKAIREQAMTSELREQDIALKQESIKAKKQEEAATKNETDRLVVKELGHPEISEKDWRI